MAGSGTLKHLSALLLRAGTAAAPQFQPLSASHSCLQCARCIATSSPAAAAADGVNAAPAAQPPAAAAAAPQQSTSSSSSGGGDGGGRSMGPVLLLPAAVAAGLGSWQLARRSEKQRQLDERLAAMRVRIGQLHCQWRANRHLLH